ncbi:MAG: molybdenum cofactor guanylyltransferase MobA [Rhodobacterales bacterium]
MLKQRVAGVILAGGQASRMGGGDKCLLRLRDGGTLLSRIVARLAPQVRCLAINANGDAARFADLGLAVLADTRADVGPLAGVLAGMIWARDQGCDAVVTVAGDTPFFPADLVARLQGGDAGHPVAGSVAVAATDRVHPVFALWDVGLAPALDAALAQGTRRVGDFTAAQGAQVIRFAVHGPVDPFFNINTPDDLARVLDHEAKGNLP